jgi:sugar lactone lactonase YvrE
MPMRSEVIGEGVTVDRNDDIFVVDRSYFNRVVEITPDGMLKTVAGGYGSANHTMTDGVPATSEPISPSAIAVDGRGNLFIGDHFGVLKVDSSGIAHYFVGDPRKPATNPKSLKLLNGIYALASGPGNVLYVLDSNRVGRFRVLKVKPSGSVSLFLRSKAIFSGMATDKRGNVYLQIENPKDRSTGILEKFSPSGKLLARIAGGAPSYRPRARPLGNFFASMTLATDLHGNILYTYANGNGGRLYRLSPAHS